MRDEAIDCAFDLVRLVPVLLGFGLLLATGTAQTVAQESTSAGQTPAPMADTATEAVAVERLAARLAARRSELDARRQDIAREFERLSTIDQPAGEAELALWRDQAAVGDGLERDMEAVRALIGVLQPETLEAVSLPEASTGQTVAPDPGLSRTTIDVNLRAVPGHPPFAVVKADTLVLRLATDAGGWSLVATPSGIGFVPVSQLSREQ